MPLHGILKLLLEGHQSVDLVSEHHLEGRMQAYPLLIIGPAAATPFHKELGVRHAGPITERVRWQEYGGELAGIKTLCQSVTFRPRVKTFGSLYPLNDRTPESEPAAGITRLPGGARHGDHPEPGH